MRSWICGIAIALGLAGPAAAEINMADSIEWITADADLVVRGRVTAVTRRKGPGDVIWFDVTIGVAETVKGAPPADAVSRQRGAGPRSHRWAARRRVTLAVRHLSGGDTPATWRARRNELLLFLVDARRRADDDKDYTRARFALRAHDGAAVVLDGATVGPAYTSAFTVLSTRADLLAAVRAAASSTATKAHRIDLPYDSPAYQSLYGGSAVWMYVPVDGRLEQLALTWVAAKDVGTREEGLAALAHFRTPGNIRVAERLLADPDYAVVTESGHQPVRRYLVRARAHQVLDAWGVQHQKPIIDEPHVP